MEQEKKINSLEVALKQVEKAVAHLHLDPGVVAKIKSTQAGAHGQFSGQDG